MSFTSPPNLTLPDTSADIIRPRKLGTVNCINIARRGEPVTLRYFGASTTCGATGQAYPTQAQAEADVLNWADGKPVAYEQHAVVPLGAVATCGKKPAPLADGELAALENLEQQAMLAPWFVVPDSDDFGNSYLLTPQADTPNGDAGNPNDFASFSFQDDAQLTAALRNALPGLLARVRAAEAVRPWISTESLPVLPEDCSQEYWVAFTDGSIGQLFWAYRVEMDEADEDDEPYTGWMCEDMSDGLNVYNGPLPTHYKEMEPVPTAPSQAHS